MKVIEPIALTNATLTASNVSEDDHAEWASGTTYAAEDRVIVIGATHKIYESVQGSNTGNDPTTDDGTWWVEISATNRWKAFDAKIADQVTNSGTITYSITPTSIVSGIGFLNINAPSARVQVFDAETVPNEIYDVTQELVDDSEITDWYTFFTEELPGFKTEALFTDLPSLPGYQIDITIGDGTGTPLVGEIVYGKVRQLGTSIAGGRVGIEDFSTKDRDTFGNAIILERVFADEAVYQFTLPRLDTRRVKRVLSKLRATPALYFVSEDMLDLGNVVYGFFQDFEIPTVSAGVAVARLEIEGLT